MRKTDVDFGLVASLIPLFEQTTVKRLLILEKRLIISRMCVCENVVVRINLLVGLMACLVVGCGPAKESAEKPEKHQFKAIVYNVQFLPKVARFAESRGFPAYRAKEIATRLAEYDVMVFNEVFAEDARSVLIEELKRQNEHELEFFDGATGKKSAFGIGNGLMIVSRFPIVERNSVAFGNDSSFADYGFKADGFAAKGVLHVRLSLNFQADQAKYVDVFGTHLESKSGSIREKQFEIVSSFIKKHSDPETPAVILGDFNTRAPHPDSEMPAPYSKLMTQLKNAKPDSNVIDVWAELKTTHGGTGDQESDDGGNRIDYIFFARPRSREQVFRPVDVNVRTFPDPKVDFLSDHSAVEATFEVEYGPGGRPH